MQASTQDQERVPPSVPPRLLFTTPDDDSGRKPKPARQRSKTVGSSSRAATGNWNDLDAPATPARRKRRATPSKSSPSKTRSRSSTESSFLPRLARILESGDSSLLSRSGIKGSQYQHRRDRSPTRTRRSRDEGGIRRSPVKHHRVSSVPRRSGTLPSFNPSLLSVLSSLTSTSGYSSSSNTTITQQSYDCASKSGRIEGPIRESGRSSDTEQHSTTRAEVPNVFDYLDVTMEDGQDGHSIRSSSSSRYQASDAGSSELPDTPSSRSTCPSPPSTRSRSVSGSVSGSVAELRRRYDPQYASSIGTRSSGSQSPEAERSPPRSIKKLSQLRDVAESDEHDSDAGVPCAEVVYDARQRSASQSYAAQLPPPSQQQQQQHDERMQAQQDALRHHIAQDQHLRAHQRVDSAYGQHRSPSSSSSRSTDSQRAWAQHTHGMQMQQYQQYQQYASSAMQATYPSPYLSMNSHGGSSSPPPPPHAPDPPDNTHRTIAGYELLAREISNPVSPVKPMYRRFEYLNHRILLHMQDELQELEEQLRCADEIVVRTNPPSFRASNEEGDDEGCHHPLPASRRNERNYGSHWHHQRTELLGRIFLKTKDYNAALASFTSVTRTSSSPSPLARKDDIEVYRSWLREKQALCPLETKFLDASTEEDLVFLPSFPPTPPIAGGDSASQDGHNHPHQQRQLPASTHNNSNSNGETIHALTDPHHLLAFATCLPIVPLVLFSAISTLPGRCVVTLLLTVGAMLLASSSNSGAVPVAQLTELLGLEARHSGVVVAGWVLVCCGIAGCVPLG